MLGELIERTCPSPPPLAGHGLGDAIAARFASQQGDRVLGQLAIRQVLGDAAAPPADAAVAPAGAESVTLRPLAAGDAGWVIARHGVLYRREYGWDASVEAFVARRVADYLYAEGWGRELERLGAIEAAFDPWSVERLESLGIDAGWHCLEIGAGAGSVACWLADRVGAPGRVLATDIDTTILEASRRPNLEVLRHDVVTDDLPDGAFDLVHTRNLLHHLPARSAVLRRMVCWVKPGVMVRRQSGPDAHDLGRSQSVKNSVIRVSACSSLQTRRAAYTRDLLANGQLGVDGEAAALEEIKRRTGGSAVRRKRPAGRGRDAGMGWVARPCGATPQPGMARLMI